MKKLSLIFGINLLCLCFIAAQNFQYGVSIGGGISLEKPISTHQYFLNSGSYDAAYFNQRPNYSIGFKNDYGFSLGAYTQFFLTSKSFIRFEGEYCPRIFKIIIYRPFPFPPTPEPFCPECGSKQISYKDLSSTLSFGYLVNKFRLGIGLNTRLNLSNSHDVDSKYYSQTFVKNNLGYKFSVGYNLTSRVSFDMSYTGALNNAKNQIAFAVQNFSFDSNNKLIDTKLNFKF